MAKMLFDNSCITVDILQDELFTEKKINVAVLRLDKIHATVSGNKLFKLHYFLMDALEQPGRPVLTFGGAYSNHLVAAACACMQLNIRSIGIVRGERPAQLSATLQQCLAFGMELQFISRNDYIKKEDPSFLAVLQTTFNDPVIIPEGGYDSKGAKGAALIMAMPDTRPYSHIVTATGTATTVAGLLSAAEEKQTIISVPALKGMMDIKERINNLVGDQHMERLQILDDYHFGGYAKYTPGLLQFMNECWIKYALPLDFVYTGKMMYAIIDTIKKDGFEQGSNILCLHTGGLQGNSSLTANSLLY